MYMCVYLCVCVCVCAGLRGSNYVSTFDGNLNHHSYPGIDVYLCQSSTAVVPPLQVMGLNANPTL